MLKKSKEYGKKFYEKINNEENDHESEILKYTD